MIPVLALLRMGATPERLAWSLAVGVVVASALVIRRHLSSLEARAEMAYPGSVDEWHHHRDDRGAQRIPPA